MISFVVPHTKAAVNQYEYGIEDPNTMTIVYLKIDEIPGLWRNGYFNELNEKLHLMIDVAEEETIIGREKLGKALVITEKYLEEDIENEYLLLIKKLLEEAIEYDTELNLNF